MSDVDNLKSRHMKDLRPSSNQSTAIENKGRLQQVVGPKSKINFSGLKRRDIFFEDPEKLVHLVWEIEWFTRQDLF